MTLTHGDIAEQIAALPDGSFDAILHDPPRFGIAGELYSQAFYDQLARVLRRKGRLFHYTGTPNKLTSGRDVPSEVMKRLRRAGFAAEAERRRRAGDEEVKFRHAQRRRRSTKESRVRRARRCVICSRSPGGRSISPRSGTWC